MTDLGTMTVLVVPALAGGLFIGKSIGHFLGYKEACEDMSSKQGSIEFKAIDAFRTKLLTVDISKIDNEIQFDWATNNGDTTYHFVMAIFKRTEFHKPMIVKDET